MDILPVELLQHIASYDIGVYRALLGVPLFARSLNPHIILDYQIHFGNRQIKITENTIKWYLNGEYHREDGPAFEDSRGKSWHQNGKLHRIDGPAVEYIDGTKQWVQNGYIHRIDGPAIEWSNGCKEWFINGKCHREDGPAVEYSNGDEEWWLFGHRLNDLLLFDILRYINNVVI